LIISPELPGRRESPSSGSAIWAQVTAAVKTTQQRRAGILFMMLAENARMEFKK
jgi:hypothetical protein